MTSLRLVLMGAVVTGVIFIAGSSLHLVAQPHAGADGKELFQKRCGGCHALDRDKEGPRLGGVHGRRAGSVDSFQYSEALKSSKITWNEESLEKWLTDPERLVPNNDMAFRLDKAEERSAIIAYLRSSGR
jgi:cytochrome c